MTQQLKFPQSTLSKINMGILNYLSLYLTYSADLHSQAVSLRAVISKKLT